MTQPTVPRTCVDNATTQHSFVSPLASTPDASDQIMGATVPPSDKRSAAELRAEAAHARRLARSIEPHEASRRLNEYADELEAQAKALEAKDKS